jgi:hypothetical protein
LFSAAQAAKETGDGSLRARESWRLGAALAEAEDFEAAHALFQVPPLLRPVQHHPFEGLENEGLPKYISEFSTLFEPLKGE